MPNPIDPSLFAAWQRTRQRSLALMQPLSAEDCAAQSMPDASPFKWHLAHTSWFFETFILEPFAPSLLPDWRAFDPSFRVLFNSYYNGVGEKHPRPQRGLLTRPSLQQVLAYRQHVDQSIAQWWQLASTRPDVLAQIARLLRLGLEHEQQHQELMLTDIKHLFSCNPLFPAYTSATDGEALAQASPALSAAASPTASSPASSSSSAAQPLHWQDFEAALLEIGSKDQPFCFDNELPRHRQFVEPFQLATRLLSNGEYLTFIEAGGYQNPALWLAEGWDWIRANQIRHPLYWHLQDQVWHEFTLHGLQPLDLQAPACHISYFEAAACATWLDARLPTEAEWEYAARELVPESAVVDSPRWHPARADAESGLQQMFGHCWQWTSSSYAPYPGFVSAAGAIGEYNGKFMVNQYVLRGSSCFTPPGHARASYRNFFPTNERSQMSGIRLARSLL